MAYWLIKSEPSSFSWEDQVKRGTANWDGVRNFQAAANLKAMKKGDRCFFYHSVDEKQIVGIVEIVKEHYPDPTDESGKFEIKGLPPGDYTIEAWHEKLGTQEQKITVGAKESKEANFAFKMTS